MSDDNENGGFGTSKGSGPRTDAIGGSSGADAGLGGGSGMGGTQSADTGITADVDLPGSAVRDNENASTASRIGSSGQTSGSGVNTDDDHSSDGARGSRF